MNAPRLTEGRPADPVERRAGELLRALQAPPRLDAAASARLAQRVAGASRAAPGRRRLVALLPSAVALALALLALRPRPATHEAFRPRGAGPSAVAPTAVEAPTLLMFRMAAGRTSEPLGDTLRRDDELAFAYRNQSAGQHLLVFGRDEHGHVFWYHPAWTDPAEDPAAIPLAHTPGLHELPAAIAHALDGRRLEICWLFTAEPLHAREVEAALTRTQLAPTCRTLEVAP